MKRYQVNSFLYEITELVQKQDSFNLDLSKSKAKLKFFYTFLCNGPILNIEFRLKCMKPEAKYLAKYSVPSAPNTYHNFNAFFSSPFPTEKDVTLQSSINMNDTIDYTRYMFNGTSWVPLDLHLTSYLNIQFIF